MPTIILLDCSLSMGRRPQSIAEVTYLSLAVHAVTRLLDYLRLWQPLEFVQVYLVGSGPPEMLRGGAWSRDHMLLAEALKPLLKPGNCLLGKADFHLSLEIAHRSVLKEWGALQPCNILLFSDDGGRETLRQVWNSSTSRWQTRLSKDLPLPPPYPGYFLLVCLCAEHNICEYYRDAVRRCNSTPGVPQMTEPRSRLLSLAVQPSSCQPVDDLVKTQLCEEYFSPHVVTLRLGELTSQVQVVPPPRELLRTRELEMVRYRTDTEFSVVGFLSVGSVYSPATVSRHLLLPAGSSLLEDTVEDERMTPNLSVLLHGAFKVEAMVGVVTLGEDWWGLLHSSAAGAPSTAAARRSSLALSMLEPGSRVAPWLGGLQYLAPYSDFDSVDPAPFPLKVRDDERSFSAAQPCWTRGSALTADVNKLVRFARKLPDKSSVFYKDYNRVRRYAIALGMQGVLERLRELLLRELNSPLPQSAAAVANRGHRDQHLERCISHLREAYWGHELLPLGQTGSVEPPPLDLTAENRVKSSAPISPPIDNDQPIDLRK